jgi:hypothetical protein
LAAKNKYFNSSAKMFLNPASIFQLMKWCLKLNSFSLAWSQGGEDLEY